jgi:hypothetical protein
LIVISLAVATAFGCADAGVTDEDAGRVVNVEVTPPTDTLDAIGATVGLVARATNGFGDEVLGKSFTWSSSNAFVAMVSREGLVEAVSNGVADITASVDGVTGGAQITVEQAFFQMSFAPGPSDALVSESAGDVTVRAEDLGRAALQNAEGPVTLSTTTGSPGALIDGPRVAQMTAGEAFFPDVRVEGMGVGYRLEAVWDGRTAVSLPFDVVAAFDAVSMANVSGTGGEIGVLVDGLRTGEILNDFAVTTTSALAEVGALKSSGAGGNDEIVIFAPERRPALLSHVDWTPGADTIEATLEAPLEVDVVVWVVKGPFVDQSARARSAIARTEGIWNTEKAGILIDSVEVVDATGNAKASEYHDLTLCNSKSGLESDIGFTEGKINVYYVGTVDSGADRGRACPIGGVHIIMGERSGLELLSHEIGHLFSLIHVDGIPASFDQTNVMHSASSVRRFLTEGQVFRQQFNPSSALNGHFGLRTAQSRACPRDTANARCPAIDGRIWDDGGFPATLVGTTAVAPDLSEGAVDRWLEIDCEMDENEGLSERVRALGDVAVAGFEVVAFGASSPAFPPASDAFGRQLNALDGLVMMGGAAARAALARLVREGPIELRADAAIRLAGLR